MNRELLDEAISSLNSAQMELEDQHGMAAGKLYFLDSAVDALRDGMEKLTQFRNVLDEKSL